MELEKSGPSVYPNPSNGSYKINWPESQYNILLTNQQGQILLIEKGIDQSEIQIPSLPGIYYLNLSDKNNQQFTIKLIKTE